MAQENIQTYGGALSDECKKQIETRMKECELALSEANRELRGLNCMRFKVLSRIEEIKHDIDFLTEHLAFPELVEPYDFSRPVRHSDYFDSDDEGSGIASPEGESETTSNEDAD